LAKQQIKVSASKNRCLSCVDFGQTIHLKQINQKDC